MPKMGGSMLKFNYKLSFIWIIISTIFFAATGATAQTTLRFGTVFSPKTSTFLQLSEACRKVEADSNGAVKIDIQPSGGFGKATELLGMVDAGTLDIAYTVQGYSPTRFLASSVMELPLIRRTATGGTRALWDLYDRQLLARDYEGLKVLGLWTLPTYGIFTADRPVKDMRGLRGLRIRASSITVARALTKLGIVPVNLPLNQMGSGLKTDLIDGVSYGWYSSTTTAGSQPGETLWQQLKYLVDIDVTGPVVMLAMRQSVFDGLPEPVRVALDTHLGRNISFAIADERDKTEESVKQKASSDGVHEVIRFSQSDMKAIRDELIEVYDEWATSLVAKSIDGPALLTAARQAVAAYEK